MSAPPEPIHRAGWRLDPLVDGELRLDGGAMWGVVPAAIWRALTPPHEDNTIDLVCRSWLARRGAWTVVIEPGVGTRWDAKLAARYGIRPGPGVVAGLAALGLAPEQVTHVVGTHAHWDHIGAQVVERDGALAPTFPRARHFLPASEARVTRAGGGARRASYRREDVDVIDAAGLLEPCSGRAEILPGLVLHELGGHSEGVSVVTIGAGADGAIFWSDVVPTAHHVQPSYVMAFDVDQQKSYDVRSHWLARAADEGWTCLYFHDPLTAASALAREGRGYRALAT
ncbi:MAG: MBL fold metallo-hydrolase [Planctomycetes bacterium]|nr:MBL fold metallo-hydrolase [Planctomycetota bacterium]